MKFIYSDVCYSIKIHTLWRLYSGLFFWACLVLFFVKLLEDTEFDGGMFTWLIGNPLMAAIVSVNLNTQANKLLEVKNKIQKGDVYESQIRTFLRLLGPKEQASKNSSILLKGFVYHHKETCQDEDCPLRREQ